VGSEPILPQRTILAFAPFDFCPASSATIQAVGPYGFFTCHSLNSPSHLQRFVQSELGITFLQQRASARFNLSQHDLLPSKAYIRNISEICRERLPVAHSASDAGGPPSGRGGEGQDRRSLVLRMCSLAAHQRRSHRLVSPSCCCMAPSISPIASPPVL
jgi:hypothetical protein